MSVPAPPEDRPDQPLADAPADAPDDARTDAELLADHVTGEHEAFGILFARHRDRLWAVALRTMGNPEDAADGLQDGLIAAYRRAGTFRGDSQVTTWLHRVVVNACLDRLRAAKVRRTQPLPEDREEHPDRDPSSTTHTPPADPADLSVAAEQRQLVLRALATLPAEQRAALVLVDMEGYPVSEVALMLDCPAGTVKSRCSRGRARLAIELRDLLEIASDEASPQGGNHGSASPVPSSTTPRAPPADDDPPSGT